MESRRARIAAELIKHLEDLDADALGEAIRPKQRMEEEMEVPEVEGVSVTVAELDPEKTKLFESGLKKKLKIPSPGPQGVGGPMDKMMETASVDDDISDEELDEYERMNA